jgi:hypothetical protein
MPGPTGPAGQDGASGAPGKDGSNGSPPEEWTYTDQNGTTYRCVPVDDFDPDRPRYTCTPTSSPSSQPEPSPTPSKQPSPDDKSSSDLLRLTVQGDSR